MAHTLYSNVVLENKVESFLTTALDMSKYATVDYSLAESAGMVKTINKYTATGAVEDLAMGVGNTTSKDIAVAFTPVSYTVKVTQGHLPYFDEEEMKLAEDEVTKTINEITRYLSLVDTMCNLINELNNKNVRSSR